MTKVQKKVEFDGLVRKTHVTVVKAGDMEFILSDETPDRYGDVIEADGWVLSNFNRNPIALFNHNSDFPIGKWKNVRVVNGELRGKLELAPEGTSDRIDEIRKLVEAGILRATSVGFQPISYKPLGKDQPGLRYTKSELLETSLVSVPANPNALEIAKSLRISDATKSLVFAKNGRTGQSEGRGSYGKHAERSMKLKGTKMSTLSERIQEGQKSLLALEDQLTKHLEGVDTTNPSEDDTAITDELTGRIETMRKSLESLKKAEKAIMIATSRDGGGEGDPEDEEDEGEEKPKPKIKANQQIMRAGQSALDVRNAKPFAVPRKKARPSDYLFRTAAVLAKYNLNKGMNGSMTDIMVEAYGEDVTTKTAMDIVCRSASAPAITTVSGWADTFVRTMYADLIEALLPVAVFPKLAALGQTYDFGQNGIISLPSRTTGNLGGGFVLQGAPIPVKQGAFAATTLTPKKMAVITTLTREMQEHSTPALEGILRQAIMEDTTLAIDTALLDNGAASATRPQGLQNAGGAAVTATTGGGIAAFVGDATAMISALIASTNGNIRKPVWIINPGDVLRIGLLQAAAGGAFPFKDELAQGRLLGYPVIQSTTGTTDTMYLVDAADFATAAGAPRFDVSDSAVLHMEDTSPAAIGTAGTPNAVAAPVRSLFQTDTLALRLIWPMDWAFRRTGLVSWVTGQSWN